MGGAFITFEGVDGCGKTSQIAALSERLRDDGIDFVATREPGATKAGAAIRSFLLSKETPPLLPEAEMYLFAADRAQHVQEVVRPALAAGKVVICDRYTDSTVAYQGYGRGIPLGLIDELNRLATGGLRPDATILLDLDLAEAGRRLLRRAAAPGSETPTRFDTEALAFHERVAEGYRRVAEAEPGRVNVVDASGTPANVAARVAAVLLPFFARWHSAT